MGITAQNILQKTIDIIKKCVKIYLVNNHSILLKRSVYYVKKDVSFCVGRMSYT